MPTTRKPKNTMNTNKNTTKTCEPKGKKTNEEMIRMRTLLLAFLLFKDTYKTTDDTIDASMDITEAFLCKIYDTVESNQSQQAKTKGDTQNESRFN